MRPIEEYWLIGEPLASPLTEAAAAARIETAFGHGRPYCAYLFADRSAGEITIVLMDEEGLWVPVRRLSAGGQHLPSGSNVHRLTRAQFKAVTTGQAWMVSRPAEFWTVM